MSNGDNGPIKILIVGGGIAGMAAAALLHRQGHEVLVIDTAPEYRNIGFGLSMWHSGRQVLGELGVNQQLSGKEYAVPRAIFVNAQHKNMYNNLYYLYGDYQPITIHRADLHEALREAVKDVPVRFGTTLESIAQDDSGVTVEFNDKSKDRFDLVIGADGVHSVVRKLAFEGNAVKPYQWRAWFFWTDGWKNKNEYIQTLLAPGSMFASYPLYDRHFAGLYAWCPPEIPDPLETRIQRLHDHTKYFDQSIHDLIDTLQPADILKTDLMYIRMGPWSKGRVVLIGDARHGLSPINGRGANLALEDSSILAKKLNNGSTHEIPLILQHFGKERTRRVNTLRRNLMVVESFLLVRSPALTKVRNWIFSILPEKRKADRSS